MRAKSSYISRGGNTKIKHICKACGNDFSTYHKNSPICQSCTKESYNTNFVYHNYESHRIPGKTIHRELAQEILDRELETDEVVHHIDEDTKNNEPNNLIVMSRKNHGKLHAHLRTQRIIKIKNNLPFDLVEENHKLLRELKINYISLSR